MATNDFKAEIEGLIKDKRDEIKTLEATLRMISGEKTTVYEDKGEDSAPNEQRIDPRSLGIEEKSYGPTLAARVKSAIQRFPVDEEFTVPHVEALLKIDGFELPGKHPRSRLAMIMTQLEEEGVVIRTAKPKGFKPHKFKLGPSEDRNMSLVK